MTTLSQIDVSFARYRKRDDRSELEEEIFNELKGYEESGLHSVLLEILACRNSILQHYKKVYDEVFKSLKDEVRVSVKNTDGLSRILGQYQCSFPFVV